MSWYHVNTLTYIVGESCPFHLHPKKQPTITDQRKKGWHSDRPKKEATPDRSKKRLHMIGSGKILVPQHLGLNGLWCYIMLGLSHDLRF